MSKTKKPAAKPAPKAASKPNPKATPARKAAPAKTPPAKLAPKKPSPAPKPAAKTAKPVPKPVAKATAKPALAKPAPAKPAPKAPVKPVAKAPAAKVPVAKTPAAKPVPTKPVAKPAPGKAPAKAQPVVAKPAAKATVPNAPGKPGGKKLPVMDHEKAVKTLAEHREKHHQPAPATKSKRRAGPIAFSLDDVEDYIRTRGASKLNLYIPGQEEEKSSAKGGKLAADKEIKVQTRQVSAVSVADLLGFNPFSAKGKVTYEEQLIPEKFRKYYKLLIELRDHVNEGLATHTEEALKKTGKEDTGDVSAYSQHMADAGSDSFDRDFALSLVNNENEALYEISEAIDRMKDGSYGVCEVTGKNIPHDRLIAVPFTRYSAEGQREIEKNRRRRGRGANGAPLLDLGEGVTFGGAADPDSDGGGEEG